MATPPAPAGQKKAAVPMGTAADFVVTLRIRR
jgi:hypothetical protein